VNARITWSSSKQATIPVLAVTRIGGRALCMLPRRRDSGTIAHQVLVTLGEPIGNVYPVAGGV